MKVLFFVCGCYFPVGCVLAFAACWFVNVVDFGDSIRPEYSDRFFVSAWSEPGVVVFFWPVVVPLGIAYFAMLFLFRAISAAAWAMAQGWKWRRWKRARVRDHRK